MPLETKIAIIAFVYAVILVEPGMILNRLALWYRKILFTEDACRTPWYIEALWKITIGCETCIAGQIAVWAYLFTHITDYSFSGHIVFVCVTIIQVSFIKLIYDKLNT